MRHRASRPLIDLWRRLPLLAARPLGVVARLSPGRALVTLLLMMGLGTGVFVAVASDVGESSERPPGPRALGPRPSQATSRSGERVTLPDEPTPGGGTPRTGRVEPSPPPSRASSAPTLTDSVTRSPESIAPTVGSRLRQAAPSPGIATPAPSTSTAHQGTAPRDRTAPNTSLTQQLPEGDAAVFSFSANEPASFSCSLDGAAFTSCGSPRSYSGLDSGWHTFAVRATDTAGNVETSPATTRWHATGAPSTDR